MADLGENGALNEAHIAGAEYGDLHAKPSSAAKRPISYDPARGVARRKDKRWRPRARPQRAEKKDGHRKGGRPEWLAPTAPVSSESVGRTHQHIDGFPVSLEAGVTADVVAAAFGREPAHFP